MTLQEEYQGKTTSSPLRLVNFVQKMNPNERGWRMMVFDLRAPNGQLVEYQIVPKEMYEAGKLTHSIYDRWRDKLVQHLSIQEKYERRDDLIRARDISEESWRNYLARTAQSDIDVKTILSKVSTKLEGDE